MKKLLLASLVASAFAAPTFAADTKLTELTPATVVPKTALTPATPITELQYAEHKYNEILQENAKNALDVKDYTYKDKDDKKKTVKYKKFLEDASSAIDTAKSNLYTEIDKDLSNYSDKPLETAADKKAAAVLAAETKIYTATPEETAADKKAAAVLAAESKSYTATPEKSAAQQKAEAVAKAYAATYTDTPAKSAEEKEAEAVAKAFAATYTDTPAKTAAQVKQEAVNELKESYKAAVAAEKSAKEVYNKALASEKVLQDKAVLDSSTEADYRQNVKIETNAKVIATKADITYVDSENAAQDVKIANNRTDINKNTARLDKLEMDFNDLSADFYEFKSVASKGIAGVAAMSQIDSVYAEVGEVFVGAGVGSFNSEGAVAIGVGYRYSEATSFRAAGSFASGDAEPVFAAGVTYTFK